MTILQINRKERKKPAWYNRPSGLIKMAPFRGSYALLFSTVCLSGIFYCGTLLIRNFTDAGETYGYAVSPMSKLACTKLPFGSPL